MMLRLLRSELAKLSGSKIAYVICAGPALIALATFSLGLSKRLDLNWGIVMLASFQMWTMFAFPMMIIALTAQLAQIEHRDGGWDALMSLPIERIRIFLAKSGAVFLLSLFAQLIFITLVVAGAWLGSTLIGRSLGSPPWGAMVEALLLVWAAGSAMTVIQMWVAIRSAHVIVPVLVGSGAMMLILGAFLFRRPEGRFNPWGFPTQVVTYTGVHVPWAVWAGLLGGGILLLLMLLDLSRRDWL